MPLIHPDVPRAQFAQPPLALVLAQLQFEPLLKISDPSFVASFQDAIRREYPTVGRVAGIELIFGPEGLEAKDARASAWSFASHDENWRVVLAQNALTLEAKQHGSYETLRDRFRDLVQKLVDLLAPSGRTRLGLRYVNKISFDDVESITGWRRLVRPELLGLVASTDLADDDTVMHTFGQTRLAEKDSQMLIRYGLIEPGSSIHPSVEPGETAYFLLDLDHFDVRHFPELDISDVIAQLDSFHDDIHRVFRWSLSDEAAERLGAGTAAENQSHHEAVKA